MNYFLGDYQLNCDFNPKIIDNSSIEEKFIDDIGFIYNCVYKQKRAFLYSIESIKKIFFVLHIIIMYS